MSIEQLKADLEEVKHLASQAKRPRILDVLSVTQRKIESEILNLEDKLKRDAPANSSSSSKAQLTTKPQENKRYIAELNEYAWDQSDKFVKIFVSLDGVQTLSEADVDALFTENSMKLTVRNLRNKDYCLTINNLLAHIDIEKSYYKIKTDMIAVYMKKQKEANSWSHLTATEKRLKEIKDSQLKDDTDSLKDDPTAGIMNLMKKMYQSGDSDTKRMIAKAWTESQEKSKQMEMDM